MRAFGSLIPDTPEFGTPSDQPFDQAYNQDAGAMSPETYQSPVGKYALRVLHGLWSGTHELGDYAATPSGLRRTDVTDIPAQRGLTGTGIAGSEPQDALVEGSTGTALGTVGSGMIFAKPGTLGAAGGRMIQNADALKELANKRRNQGLATGKSAGGLGVPGPAPQYASWEDALKGTLDEPKAISEPRATAAAGDLGPGGGGPLGTGSLPEAQAKAARWAGEKAPLKGIPGPLKIGEEHFVPGPIGKIHDIADAYMAEAHPDRPYTPPTEYHPLDPEHSKAIAKAYEEMPHTPNDLATKASYDALIDETAKQYEAIKKTGLKIEPIPAGMKDPYAANPRLAAHDVAENNHLWFYPTESGYGKDIGNPEAVQAIANNPMLRDTGETLGNHKLLANDMFRVVHDYFGHLKEGHGFRAGGEDNAWRTHSAMYSDLARPAMTSETRGQNSWVNYGPHGEANRKASAADTVYADQKVGLMPEWTMRDRNSPEPTIVYHGSPYAFSEMNPNRIGAGEGAQVYGHGLYFAEHSPVSEWYRHQLAARRDPLLEKYGLTQEDGARMGMDLANHSGNVEPVVKGLQKYIAENQKRRAEGDTSKATKDIIERSQKMAQYMQDPARFKGHMYQVAIDQPQEHFLDWDAPFSSQSPHVQERMQPIVKEAQRKALLTKQRIAARGVANLPPNMKPYARTKGMEGDPFADPTGQKLYELAGFANPAEETPGLPVNNRNAGYVQSSKKLQELGIPGIKYLDQGSRVAGGGVAKKTRNFVTFGAPRILKRYAIGGAVGGGFGSLAAGQDRGD